MVDNVIDDGNVIGVNNVIDGNREFDGMDSDNNYNFLILSHIFSFIFRINFSF